ncbi:MAG TPA: hypothetical protein PLG59_13045 [bacterium]|nr:hypothetical protein [bacterium]
MNKGDKYVKIVEETVRLYEENRKPLPPPMSGRDFVNSPLPCRSSNAVCKLPPRSER